MTPVDAKVKDGRLIVDPPVELPEGATVTVLIDDGADGDDRELTPKNRPSSMMRSMPAEQPIAELRRRWE